MKRPWLAAAGTAALTGLLFSIVYNFCNWVTRLRSDVAVWVFEWERHWPVIPGIDRASARVVGHDADNGQGRIESLCQFDRGF